MPLRGVSGPGERPSGRRGEVIDDELNKGLFRVAVIDVPNHDADNAKEKCHGKQVCVAAGQGQPEEWAGEEHD